MLANIKIQRSEPESKITWDGKTYYMNCRFGEIVYIEQIKDHKVACTFLWRNLTDQEIYNELDRSKVVRRLCKDLDTTPDQLGKTIREILTKFFQKPTWRSSGFMWEKI